MTATNILKRTKSALHRLRSGALLRIHRRLDERRGATAEAVSTSGLVPSSELAPVQATHLTPLVGYEPTPRLVLDWILEGLAVEFERTTFVDLGSGRGRTLLQAARRPFRRVEGVEFSPALNAEAVQNIEAARRGLTCADVSSTCLDVADYDIPDGDTLLYLFNPFDAELLSTVVERAIERAAASGSRLTFVYYNPVHREILDSDARLAPRTLPLGVRLRLRALAPCRTRVYERIDG